jgi:transposase
MLGFFRKNSCNKQKSIKKSIDYRLLINQRNRRSKSMLKIVLTKLLNIKHYYVSEIILFTESEIKLKIRRYDHIKAICSGCGHEHIKGHHSTDTIKVKDLSITGRKVFLIVELETYRCAICNNILVEKNDWIFIRSTKRYAADVYRLTSITTNTEAGWYLGIDDEVVYRIDKRMLEEIAEEKLNPYPAAINLSVDEVSYKKYHRYLTNVIDTDKKLIIWNEKGRKSEILDKYFQGIGEDNCKKIKSVAIDGAKTYISSTKKYATNALIVYDKFHIMQKLNNTVDTVRKIELDKARKNNNKEIVNLMNCKQRFILLKNKNKLTERQDKYLNRLCEINKPIYKAILLKESFLELYNSENIKTVEDAKMFLLKWIYEAKMSELIPFIELAKSFTVKFMYIINWFHKKISSAISEGFNNKIKRLKRMAYGYKDIEYFKLKIHQHCGLLNPRLQLKHE